MGGTLELEYAVNNATFFKKFISNSLGDIFILVEDPQNRTLSFWYDILMLDIVKAK